MRDSNRLDEFYNKLKEIHKEHFPDWRFMQLIDNLQSFCGSDLFYVEENKLLELFDKFVKRMKT